MNLRPIDLARAAGISAQQVRRYESLGLIPSSTRTANGYRIYTEAHREALLRARKILAGLGWERGFWAIHHLAAGRPQRAFAIADRVHMELHLARRSTLETISALDRARDEALASHSPSSMTITAAANRAGVTASAIRHWEREGLVAADRDETNGYRRYSRQQLQRIQLVALLRSSGYGVALIRQVLDGMEQGNTAAALAAARRRLDDINAASLRCAMATAALVDETSRLSEQADDSAEAERIATQAL